MGEGVSGGRGGCPRDTGWCVQHDVDVDQCGSISLRAGRVNVWLVQEIPGIEPAVVVDAPTSGGDLSLVEALDLADSLQQLWAAARSNEPVRV